MRNFDKVKASCSNDYKGKGRCLDIFSLGLSGSAFVF